MSVRQQSRENYRLKFTAYGFTYTYVCNHDNSKKIGGKSTLVFTLHFIHLISMFGSMHGAGRVPMRNTDENIVLGKRQFLGHLNVIDVILFGCQNVCEMSLQNNCCFRNGQIE